MPQSVEGTAPSTWREEIAAGLVVCLVALPLCLGIALASGAPLVAGLVTGVLGGLVVSWLGGTHLLVSGPAAGLAAIVLAAIGELGSYEALLPAVVLGGVLQVVLGAAKAGRLARFVPAPVVTGMLAAIGVLLILQQIPHALGARPEKAHGYEVLLLPVKAVGDLAWGPALVSAVALGVLLAFDRPALAKVKKVLPGPLAAVLAGTVVAEAIAFLPALALGPELRVALPKLTDGLAGVLPRPDWSVLGDVTLWRVALTLGIVASLETLLSLEATDQLDPLKRRSDANRELLAQGVGNALAGLAGGLPMTGVIVRSAANVDAGGRTWRSAFVHGVFLLLAVLALPDLLSHVPLAALAAVLLHTGWKLAHPKHWRAAFAIGRNHLVPLATTVVGVVVTDLLMGVIAGLGSAVLLARRPAAASLQETP
jgi:MFS superfamily sulfate permease-like transporter